MRVFIVGLGLGLVACDADFTEIDVERPGAAMSPGGDAGRAPGDEDAGSADAAPSDSGPSDGSSMDAGPFDQGAPTEVVVRRGVWENAGYAVRGTSEIVRLADGSYEIRMSDDFVAANLPGPTLLFSDRDRIGSSGVQEGQGDIRIGRLDQVSGPIVFSIPAEAADRRFAWIYCEPFSVEMHVAELVAP